MSRFHPLPDLALLRRRINAVAQDCLSIHIRQRRRQSQAPYDGLRMALVHHVEFLGLHAPFSWQAYIGAVQRAYVSHYPNIQIEVAPTHLPQGTSARWVVVSGQLSVEHDAAREPLPWAEVSNAMDNSTRTAQRLPAITASLLVALRHDKAYIERAVYHEMGHLELGHLSNLQPVSDTLRREWAPHVNVPDEANTVEACREKDAEQFATALIRLAHGWDPALLSAPRLDDFFGVLG